jgi:heat shock protein HslJ
MPSRVNRGHTGCMITARRVLTGSLLVAMSLVATACGDDSTSNDAAAPIAVADLQGKQYELVDAVGIAVPEGSALTMHFIVTNLAISGGCNNMSGGWRIESNRLMVPRLAQTNKACDEALMTFDAQVAQVVSSQPTITLDGEKMSLARDAATLNFRELTVADAALEGTPWTVTGTVANDAVTGVSSEPATLLFKDGTLELFAGCNSGSGTYTTTDTTIEFGPIALTKKACEGAATELETAVTGVLQGTATYEVVGTELSITGADGSGLILTSAP